MSHCEWADTHSGRYGDSGQKERNFSKSNFK